MLVCATLFWAGNFNIGKFAFIESISPFTLAFLRWLLVWIILMPLTYREILSLKNPLSKSRVKNLINNAKYMLGDLPEHEDEWLGFRPTLPDFLPVMGPSKNYKNVFYCFGHHHLGWTLGPISGKIVSGMIANENTNLDLKPYSSLRFN